MTLLDHQTGREIISPYLLIGEKDVRRYAVNTESFRNCQDWLILPDTFKRDVQSDNFRELNSSSNAPVFAVIGNYNSDLPLYGTSRTVSLVKSSKFELKIGVIPLAILERELPKVYDSIRGDIESARIRVAKNPQHPIPF